MLGPIAYHAQPKRTPEEQVRLACRILDHLHEQDIVRRARASHGDRADVIMPADMSYNLLTSWVGRINRTHTRPPLVDGMREDLAQLLGDYSSSVLINRYSAVGGRPMPTSMVQAVTEAHRYRTGAGYAAVELRWSYRARRIIMEPIAPVHLDLEYGSDDPTEPTVVRRQVEELVDGERKLLVAEWDLTDLDRPVYRVLDGSNDVTSKVLGDMGAGYWWRYADGTPFHPIVVTGHPGNIFRTLPLVEATLALSMRWSSWGSGTDHGSHPQRNVVGMRLLGMGSDTSTGSHGGSGISTGAETILVWEHMDPERPGQHWQDAPAFDPELLARAIMIYGQGSSSAMGWQVDLHRTGGEPTATEAAAIEDLISDQYAECRRLDSEILRRSAAIANRLPAALVPGVDFDETPYSALYRSEIDGVIVAPETPAEEQTDE